QNGKGAFGHAPFQFCLPIHAKDQPLQVSVEAKVDRGEAFHVEMWDGNHYTRVGTLSTSATTSFDLPSLSERSSNETRQHTSLTPQLSNRLQPEENAPPDDARTLVDFQNNLSIYGNQKAVFQEVDLLDENGCSKRVYQVGDLLQLKMTIFAKEFIPH